MVFKRSIRWYVIPAAAALAFVVGVYKSTMDAAFKVIENGPVPQAMINLRRSDHPQIVPSDGVYSFTGGAVRAVYYDMVPGGFSCGDRLVNTVTGHEASVVCHPWPKVIGDSEIEVYAKDLVSRVRVGIVAPPSTHD